MIIEELDFTVGHITLMAEQSSWFTYTELLTFNITVVLLCNYLTSMQNHIYPCAEYGGTNFLASSISTW